MWYSDIDIRIHYGCNMLLLQKNEAKSKPGSRRTTWDKLDTPLLPAPKPHQPARLHLSVVPDTASPEPPHRAPRRALSASTARPTATLYSSSPRPPRALSASTALHTATLSGSGPRPPRAPLRSRRPHSRGEFVPSLWITCGKPGENPPRRGGYEEASVDNSRLIHRLSTRYPQVIHK